MRYSVFSVRYALRQTKQFSVENVKKHNQIAAVSTDEINASVGV